MILFIFEGAAREPTLFKTMEHLFFSNKTETMICSFNNNIYNLYKKIKESIDETGEPEDIITILKDKLVSDKDNPLQNIPRRSDFSEVYLFFDYDSHNNKSQQVSNEQINAMLEFFNDETSDFGKLYISYPMIESVYCAHMRLPNENYCSYTSPVALGKKYKQKVKEESFYGNLDFVAFRENRKHQYINLPKNENRINEIRQNWIYLVEMNVKKANYICYGKNTYPAKKENIGQKNIFKSQLEKYVQRNSEVAVLFSFPLFLYDYKSAF